MKAKEFKNKAEKLIDKIQDLINQMPYKGDTQSDSQKICLTHQLNEFYYTVNGVEDSDFIEDED